MYIEGKCGMITHLRLKAYGKINLALDVLGKREDGYHEVRMIMQTVGLHDSIDLYRIGEPGIRIETNLLQVWRGGALMRPLYCSGSIKCSAWACLPMS